MDTFVWDDVFLTGLDTVDEQHRRLVELVNELSASLIDGANTDEAALQAVIDKLADYANYHFAEEERLMKEAGIDLRHLLHHQANHRKFFEQVTSMWNARHSMADPANVLLEFLIAWLSFHILGEDQAMARQVQRIQAGETPARALELEESPHDKGTSTLLKALHNLYHVLSEQNQDLASANQHLEARVAERTRELEEANRKLELSARTDGLLGIANRMYFDSQIEIEWGRARREKQPLGLLMIDVDYFKRYNDKYGHQMGDACLRSVAKAAASALRRPGDLIARYGGEELVVLLPNTPLAGACTVAESIQAKLAELNIPHQASDVAPRVTVSIGAASLQPDSGNRADELIAAADGALYAAKAGGRNRVQAATSPVPVGA